MKQGDIVQSKLTGTHMIIIQVVNGRLYHCKFWSEPSQKYLTEVFEEFELERD